MNAGERKISPESHPQYPIYERFFTNYPDVGLHLIPESQDKMTGLSSQFKFPTGETLNIAKPVRNIQGATALFEEYGKFPPGSFAKRQVHRWMNNYGIVRLAAEKRGDENLVNVCRQCEEVLGELYQRCLNINNATKSGDVLPGETPRQTLTRDVPIDLDHKKYDSYGWYDKDQIKQLNLTPGVREILTAAGFLEKKG